MTASDDNRLRRLASMARALARSTSLESTLEIATAETLRALEADSASISRLEPGSWLLRTLINDGELGPTEERWPADELYRLEDFPAFTHVYRDRQVWVTSLDDPAAYRADISLLTAFNKGSAVTAPLVVDATVWGELYVCWATTTGAFEASNTAYLDVVTALVESGISQSLDAASLKQLAFRDPLTGLANRRGLDLAVEQVVAEVDGGTRRRISVVVMDINDLKVVNDTTGHDAGDHLIRAVARLVEDAFAELFGSLPARVGGDEFAILVPGHSVATVLAAADRVCVQARLLDLGAGVSCGIASQLVVGGEETARLLFSAADAAMYRAKRTGSRSAVLAPKTDTATGSGPGPQAPAGPGGHHEPGHGSLRCSTS